MDRFEDPGGGESEGKRENEDEGEPKPPPRLIGSHHGLGKWHIAHERCRSDAKCTQTEREKGQKGRCVADEEALVRRCQERAR